MLVPLTLIASALAVPPDLKEGYFTTVQFDGGNPVNLVVFKMDFDQDVYLKNGANITMLSQLLQPHPTSGYPMLGHHGIDIVSLNCTDQQSNPVAIPSNFMPPNGTQLNGPPVGYVTSPPSNDPAASLLNIIFKGLKLEEEYLANRYALVYPLPQNIQPDRVSRMTCQVKFNTDRPYSVTNKDGEAINATFNMNFTPPKCSHKEVDAMIDFGKRVFEYSKSVRTSEELNSYMSLVNTVMARETFAGCKRMVQSWMSFKNTTITTNSSKQCVWRFEQPEWRTDPCCNHELLQTQCCRPRTISFPARIVDTFNSTTIAGICKNPSKITGLLTNVVDAMKGESQQPFELSFSSTTGFLQICNNEVFNQRCTSDADCPYSGTCGQNGNCFVDYSNPGPAFVKCALVKMTEEVKLEFKASLGLPTSYEDPEAEIRDLTAAILNVATSEDCAGPESEPFRRKFVHSRTPEGRFIQTIIPGNRTGCLVPKECSFEPWNRNSEQRCTQDSSYRQNFCAQCKQGFCNPITQFSKCMNQGVTPEYCASVNGIFDTQQQSCSFPTRDTEALCLTGPNCRNTSEPWRCDRTVCINTNITQIQSCNGSYRWDWGLGKCVLAEQNVNQSNCNGVGLVYAPGIRFESGRFNTQASCPSSSCDNFQVIAQGGNSTDCRTKGYCTSSCSRCRSNSYDNGVCRNTTVSASNECFGLGGNWIRQGESSTCIVQSAQSACSGTHLQWSDCNTLNQTTCNTSPFSVVLGCQWSQFDTCKTPETCQAAGFCDDWEFGNSQSDGVCVYRPVQPNRCDSNPSTRNGMCIDRSIRAQNQCIAPNVWRTRAKTSAECLAQGSICVQQDGMRTLMNQTDCESCGGKFQGVYKWNVPRWVYGNMVNTTWERIEWRPRNQWINVLDMDKLQKMFNQATAAFFARSIVNRFSERYSVYATIFKYAACDCFSTRADCFGDGPIKAKLTECQADPASTSSCGGVSVPPGLFPNGTAVSIQVNMVSAASYIGTTPTNNTLLKRQIQASTYEVVQNGDGSIIGQLVGNGKQFAFGAAAITNVSICLDIDQSIAQSTQFTNLDFVQSINGVLTVPLKLNATLQGTQVCGTVPPFTDSTFLPILRNNATIIQRAISSSVPASGSATASATGSASATGTRPVSSAQKNSFYALLISLLFSLF